MNKNDLGIVETKYFHLSESADNFVLKNSERFKELTLAYETYGTLNDNKDNVILVCHALTGDAHAAGWHEGEKKPGWWNSMIGPGKAFDTDKYFIICSNVLGSCKGSTGPSSNNPKTNKPYGLDFPSICIEDMINAQKLLIDYLEIDKLFCVVGGSMGGAQALQWAISYPDHLLSAIVISINTRHRAQQIAFHEVGRQAIMSDPDWFEGDYYYKKTGPSRGLALARMVGHITYMSENSMEDKFGRKTISKEYHGRDFSQNFEVGNYLRYRGDSFVERFDANSYLYLTKALDHFNLAEDAKDGSLVTTFSKACAKFLIISFTSDWLYPPHQSKEMVRALKAANLDVSDIEIASSYGHDSFLVETESQSKLIQHFLIGVNKNKR